MCARWMVTLFMVAALPLAACADSGPRGGSPAPSLTDTTWDLAEYVPIGEAALVAVPEQVRATAAFSADQITGSGGCNSFFGSYSTDGSAIDIGPLGSTLVACDPEISDVEGAYLAQLELATTFAITDGTLALSNEGGDVVLTFTESAPTPLTGSTWQATGVNNGKGGVQSLVGDTTIIAQFADGGTLTGSAGCNSYSGTFEVDGDAMTIGPLATTRKACDPDVTTQEMNYLAALEKVSTYSITGDSLELRDESGALQAGYVDE